MPEIKVKKISNVIWEIPKGIISGMKVPARIYATEKLVQKMQKDRTLLQAAGVACLPGIYKYSIVLPDGHEGYGFPIGGVAALDAEEGAISPGGIGYDINCLSPDSKIITEHGYWLKVKDLPNKLEQSIKIYNIKEGHNDSSEILFVAERDINNGERAVRIVTETGKIIEGSEEHLVLTPNGYVCLGNIKEKDEVIVYPFEGVEFEERRGVVLSEKDFKKEDKQVINYLKKRNLLPLSYDNPKIGILARILGFAFGDGYLGDMGKRIVLAFYGKRETLKELEKDLKKLNVKSRLYVRKYKGESVSCELRVYSRSFAVLMQKLGMPKGKKTEQIYSLPDWIKEAPIWIKRNFLAGFFGADGSVIKFKKNTPLPINLTQSKKEFLNDIAKLLEEFNIKTTIYKIKSKKNVTYRLSIIGERSIRNFLGKINYEYSLEKKNKGLMAYAYLKFKENIKKKSFEEFVKEKCYEGGFVAEKVVKVERIKPDYNKFYDVGVLHESHNFIANGIVVHNCGVRLVRTDLTIKDVKPKIREIVDTMFKNVPSGVGSRGLVKVRSQSELDEVLELGAKWAVENGYGVERDLEVLEENGCMQSADPKKVSPKAKQRGMPQLGSLGSGNHFLEVQVVDEIYNSEVAKAFGIEEKGQICIMIHTGSRGLGHQVCSDYLREMERQYKHLIKNLPDRELIYAPIKSDIAKNYFAAMSAAANFAWCNRQMIVHWVRESFEQVFKKDWESLGMEIVYDVAHNIAKLEEHEINGKKVKVYVHRKGATRAFPPKHRDIPKKYHNVGQPVIIPGSMGTASYLLVGSETAMKETFGSTAHGAGREMSRSKAIKQFRGSEIAKALEKQGIYVHGASWRGIAEEAPQAYKDIDEVVRASHEAGIGKLVVRLRPMGVVKG